MDPVSGTLGLVAGIASIVTIIGKSVCTLNTIRAKYKDAAFNVNLLTAHLHTVKVALLQVETLVIETRENEPQHQQLMVELEQSLDHCGSLIQHIHDHISKFEWNDELLRVGNKALFLLEDQNTKDMMTHLDRHINALNLFLNAFRCRTPNEQKRFLDRAESRIVLDLARDDTTSLVGFRDSMSFSSSSSRSSIGSQLSKAFDFDGLLLRHKIYQNSFRSMLRRVSSPTESRGEQHKKRTLSDTPSSLVHSDSKTSAQIDFQLKEDARKMKSEIKMLAIGDKHGRSTIVRQMRTKFGQPFTDAEVEQYRQSIIALTVKALVAILDYVEYSTGLVSQTSKDHGQIVRDFATSGKPDWLVSSGVAASIKHIWQNWHVKQAYSIMQQHGQTAYYLSAIDRVCVPDYVPTNMDIIRAPETIDTVKETEMVIGTMSLRVAEIKDKKAMRIMPQFAGVEFCLFTIDLTCYNRYLDDERSTNELDDRLAYLKAIFRSEYFDTTIVLLVFTNSSAFEKQIAHAPLKSHFEDYTGGNSVEAATKYILGRCKRTNKLQRPFFWHSYNSEAHDREAESMANFFRQSAASVTFVTWLRDIGLGPGT